jgi:hypothetical protein
MPNVSQSVPSYFGGISQESDYEMAPGHLKDIVNAYPDITYGLRKRPGLRYEYSLGNATDFTNAKWFTITQSEIAPHLACIVPTGELHVWNLLTQVKLTGTATNDYTYLSKNDTLFPLTAASYACKSFQNVAVIVNRKCRVLASSVNTPGTTTSKVTTYADLIDLTPTEGDIVNILNTPNADEDDFYVKYEGGAWEETVKPGIPNGIDDTTLAHTLRINDDNTFTFQSGGSERRIVGDEKSNPNPSFVGSFLTNVFFYLNRVGFLSQDNIFLTQPLRPNNVEGTELQSPSYYYNSALVSSDADPLDLNASTVRATNLISVLPTVQGLMLFGNNEQFILYSEQGVVTPNTAMIKSISTFEMNETTDAVQMGDDYYFISKTQRNTRVFQLIVRGINQAPVLNDVGKIIADYIPSDIDSLKANSQNQFISLSSSTGRSIYNYRVYKENDESLFRAWYSWQMPGNILLNFFVLDRFFALVNVDGKLCVNSAALNLVPAEDQLTNVPLPDPEATPGVREGVGPFLDLWLSPSTVQAITVTPTSIETTKTGIEYWVDPIVTFPTDYPNSANLVPCAVKTNVNLTRVLNSSGDEESGVGYTVTPTINANGTWTIPGNFRTDQSPASWVVGYRFNYNLVLPKTYFQTDRGSDWLAYTVVDRYKFFFREVSDLSFKIQRKGYPEENRSITPANIYQENTITEQNDGGVMLPIHQRNAYFDLRIFSDSPFPVTLSSMYWEGLYNPRYYKRY